MTTHTGKTTGPRDAVATARRLRFGIMCAGPTFTAWQALSIRSLLDLPEVELGLLIFDERAASRPKGPRLKRLASRSVQQNAETVKAVARNLTRTDNRLFDEYLNRRVEPASKACAPVDMAAELEGVPAVTCAITRKGRFSEYFQPADVATIRSHDLDFILRFGFGIIRGDVLESARYGVWSFHHGDELKYRGTPPGFWEIVNGEDVTGTILQRLTNRLDGGVVLYKGWFKTERRYAWNRDSIHFGAATWPARVCKRILAGDTSRVLAEPSTTNAPIYFKPDNRQMLDFTARSARLAVSSRLRGALFAERQQWNVGVVAAPIAAFLGRYEHLPVHWLPTPEPDRFFADPFGLVHDGRLSLLVEDYDYGRGRGRISALELRPDGTFSDPVPAIDEPFHLSYPMIVEHEGAIYCIPEMGEANRLVAYRAVRFPTVWEEAAVLLRDIAAIDPTVFAHEGRFYMLFTTPDDVSRGADLRLMHAPHPLGPWEWHPLDPVLTDVRRARGAGTPFVHEGALYRPCQDTAGLYGRRVTLTRITKLSTTEYEEQRVSEVTPFGGPPFDQGVHTLSSAGPHTLIDGMRLQEIRKSPFGKRNVVG